MAALLFTFAVLLIDQVSKCLILARFQPGESLPIIKNVFHLSLIFNKGFAFGLLSRQSTYLVWTVYIIVLSIVFISVLYRNVLLRQKSTRFFLSLVLAGAIGNLIDRIRFGAVVDFLDLRIWPVFNVADAAITIGVTLFLIQVLKTRQRP